jgi:hypothetical protein
MITPFFHYTCPLPQVMGVIGADNQSGTEMILQALKDEQGGSFDAVVLILLQDYLVDMLNYNDVAPSSFCVSSNVTAFQRKPIMCSAHSMKGMTGATWLIQQSQVGIDADHLCDRVGMHAIPELQL